MKKLLHKIKCCWHILFAKDFSVFTDNGKSYWCYLNGNKYFILHMGTLIDKSLDKYLTSMENTKEHGKGYRD